MTQPVRADLDPGIGHLTYLLRGQAGVAWPFGVPRVVPPHAAGDHIHRRAEPNPLKHRQRVLGEIGVAVIESESDKPWPASAGAGIEHFTHGRPAQTPPTQPAHLLLKPRWADDDLVVIMLVRSDRVIHHDNVHAPVA